MCLSKLKPKKSKKSLAKSDNFIIMFYHLMKKRNTHTFCFFHLHIQYICICKSEMGSGVKWERRGYPISPVKRGYILYFTPINFDSFISENIVFKKKPLLFNQYVPVDHFFMYDKICVNTVTGMLLLILLFYICRCVKLGWNYAVDEDTGKRLLVHIVDQTHGQAGKAVTTLQVL